MTILNLYNDIQINFNIHICLCENLFVFEPRPILSHTYKMEFLSCLFLALSCLLPTVISCSCPIEVTSSTRSEAICSFYSSESFIYAATVTSAYCKCTPSTSTINHRQFSCINFRSDLQGNVTGNVEETYRCPAGDLTIQVVYYDICNSTIRNAGTTSKSHYHCTLIPFSFY